MPTTFRKYKVLPGGEVAVDAIIGNGQPGGSTIFLGTVLLAHTAPADPDDIRDEDINVRDLRIGAGSDLVGKSLVISTDVLDLRDIDQAIVTIVLRGGSPEEEVIQHIKEGVPFTAVNFMTIVDFVA